MSRYRIGDTDVSSGDPGFAAIIEKAYKDKVSPLCLCREDGVPMYIAHYEAGYFVKRLPDSALHHSAQCDSFESPAELSGLGDVAGSAIQVDDDGQTNLKLAFSLSRNAAQEKTNEGAEKTSATASGSRLTLRGLLHHFWDRSKLTYWEPDKKKPSWFSVRKELLKVSAETRTKKSPFADVLFIPEYFDPTRSAEILHRRTRALAPAMGKANAGKKLMVLIGELKSFSDAANRYTMRIKHLHDFPFRMSQDLYKRFHKVFNATIGHWTAVPEGHMVVAATFTIDGNGFPEAHEITAMLTDELWIPLENQYDQQIVELLVTKRRSFHKEMRYNLTSDKAIASFMLRDIDGDPLPMYLDLGDAVSKWASPESIEELIEASNLDSWLWNPMNGVPPPLPPPKAPSSESVAPNANAAIVEKK